MMRIFRGVLFGIWVLLFGIFCFTFLYSEVITNPRHVVPPPPPQTQAPQRMQAGEPTIIDIDYGPTQRRSEKKKPPSSPSLVVISKLEYGDKLTAFTPDGREYSFNRWAGSPNDAYYLASQITARFKTGVSYRHINSPFAGLAFTPFEIPLIYISGDYVFSFTDKERESLKKFVEMGGFLLFNSCCGSPEFTECAKSEIEKMFGEGKLKTLSLDHPVYSSFYFMQELKYFNGPSAFSDMPKLKGLDVGCRTAVFFSEAGYSCAWSAENCKVEGEHVEGEDAYRMGVNLVAYVLGTSELAGYLARDPFFYEGRKRKGQEFTFVQLMCEGNWEPDPNGTTNLILELASRTGINVNYGKKDIKITDEQLFDYPFVYMTGHDDFVFSDEEILKLRDYLTKGGFLLADACCGRKAFDVAFKREIRRVLPNEEIKPLSPGHPVYKSGWLKIDRVEYTEKIKSETPELDIPIMEGIHYEGDLVVVYSRYDLGCGWEREECPYCKGYSSFDATSIGVNIISYVLSH